MKRLLFMMLIISALLTSCVKQDYDPRYWHQISIDPEKTDTYQFLDIADGVAQHYHTRSNGDGYTFEVNGNITTFTFERQMTEVRVVKSFYYEKPIYLEIVNNTVTVEDLDPEWAFRIYHD